MSLDTDEIAQCKYSATSSTAFASMVDVFTNTSSTFHSTTLSGLTDGSAYSNYVRCVDGDGNENTDDFLISFDVPLPDLTAPVISNTNVTGTPPTATVTWNTDDSSDSAVMYGTSPGVLDQQVTDAALVTSHSLEIPGLEGLTLYYYKVSSCNIDGPCNTSTVASFSLPGQASFTVIDDATVQEDSPDTNYGASPVLEVDLASPHANTYLKFNVTGTTGQITSAVVKIVNADATTDGGEIYHVTSTSWDESTITWNNRPLKSGGALDALGAVDPGNTYSLDVSSVVTANGTYSFVIVPTVTNGADYESKEGANAPVLEVEFAGAGGTSQVLLSADPAVSVTEGGAGTTTTAEVLVTLSETSSTDVMVDYATVDGTATTGDNDYVAPGSTLTISAGNLTGTISIVVNGDDTFEPNETFTVVLSNATTTGTSTVVSITQATSTVTILDDDGIHVDVAAEAAVSVTEGGAGATTTADVVVTLSATSTSGIMVDYTTSDGTATTGDGDYVALAGTLNIPAGSATGTISIVVNGDYAFETNETFSVTLSNATTTGTTTVLTIIQPTATVTILNDDAPPVNISAEAAVSVTEGNAGATTTADIIVTLSGTSADDVMVDYATSDGTATTGDSDYVATGSTLTISAGNVTGTISIVVNGDGVFESDETFTVSLSNATTTGTTTVSIVQGTTTVTILNDDAAPIPVQLDFTPADDATVQEDNPDTNYGASPILEVDLAAPHAHSYLKFVVTGITGPVISSTVKLVNRNETTDGGSIYHITSTSWDESTITWNNRPLTSTAVALDTLGAVAVGFTYALDVSDVVNGNGTYSFVLVPLVTNGADYDSKEGLNAPVLEVMFQAAATSTEINLSADVAVSVTEGDAGTTTTADILVTLSEASLSDVMVDYATIDGTATAADGDYVPPGSTLTIPAGNVTGTISIVINGDDTIEPDETFTVTLSNATTTGTSTVVMITQGTSTVTVLDDDTPPSVSVESSVSVAEGGGAGTTTTAEVLVTLVGLGGREVSVGYTTVDSTATVADGDYVASGGRLTIPAGNVTGTIAITVNGDDTSEPDETFVLALFNATTTGTSTPVTITQSIATVTILNYVLPVVSETRLNPALDGTTAVVDVAIDRFKNPADSSTSTLEFESFVAGLTYDTSRIEIVDVIGVAPFGTTTFTSTDGILTITGTAGGATVSATPVVVAKIAVRLIGSALSSTNLTLASLDVTVAGTAQQVSQDQAAINSFTRGNTQTNSATVNIFDALFIAQCLAGLREYGTATTECHPSNAASVRHDGAAGDRVNIFDALFIAQYLAGLKDDKFQ